MLKSRCNHELSVECYHRHCRGLETVPQVSHLTHVCTHAPDIGLPKVESLYPVSFKWEQCFVARLFVE